MKYFSVKFIDSHYASLAYTKLKNKVDWISQCGNGIGIEPDPDKISFREMKEILENLKGFESINIIKRTYKMDKNIIKPCPFCGSKDNPVQENSRQFYGPNPYTEIDYYLECTGCNLLIGYDPNHDEWGDRYCDFSTKEEALKVWNTRKRPK